MLVVINQTGDETYADKIKDVCNCPVLQDTAEVNAWDALGAGYGDVYIVDEDGTFMFDNDPMEAPGDNPILLGQFDCFLK